MPHDYRDTNVKKYVVYDVTILHESNECDPHPATIERRYRNFLTLYDGLRKDHSQLMSSVVFPRKVLLGNFTSDLVAERSELFEQFLDYVVGKTVLRESPYFLEFLQEIELVRACQLLDERRNEQAVPILENSFRLLNKVNVEDFWQRFLMLIFT